MNKEEIEALFPITATVTQEIIESAENHNCVNCIGAKTLQSVIPKELVASWGAWTGRIQYGPKDIDYLKITTQEGVGMPAIKKPQEVTFILCENNG